MPISFSCPHCGHSTQADDQYAGQTGPCVSCGGQVTIPGPAAQPTAPMPGKAPQTYSSTNSSGAIVAISIIAVLGIMVVCGGVLVALLLPAVQTARESARRMSCQNNMKQLALAMHNYHDVYKTFPLAFIPDEEGQPMRSWRASILPFIEQQQLYDQYDFHERWDAPQNEFARRTPIMTYMCPSDPTHSQPKQSANSNRTSYVLITGPGTIFEAGKPSGISSIRDGTANTILAVELFDSGIEWSEPRDLDIEAFVAMFGPGGTAPRSNSHPGGINVAMADGSVQFLSFSTSQQDARAMATSSGGEPIRMR